jgi:hypothetical protein
LAVSPVAKPPPPRVSEVLIGSPLSSALAVACVLLIAGWLPHYLTWPWWPDLDAFAAIAQGWDAGILPYRDVSIFNFPGQIELLWVLGKVFGWGRTWPIYALDAAILIALGFMMAAWSRRALGRGAPGLVGFLAFLYYYLSLDYTAVAQRDWQGPVLVFVGMMLVQARPAFPTAILSGLLFGLAFVIRPHVLLFAPAALIAVATIPFGEFDHPSSARNRALFAWAIAAGLAAAVGFAPLAAQGLLGDFVRGVRQASYGRYGKYPASLASRILGPLRDPKLAIGIILASASALVSPPAIRRAAVPWVVGLLLALAYRPFHPVQHDYLAHPLWLVWSVNLAVTAGAAMTSLRPRPGLALASIAPLVVIASPGLPRFFDAEASLRALGEIGRGAEPTRAPPGAETHFAPLDTRSPYTWEQYRQVLSYLRQRTGPDTRVANLLRNVPFPSLNGTVGRICPLPADSGIIWLYALGTDREADFARALEAAEDAVVVWIPGERTFDPRLQLPNLEPAVLRHYRPEATVAGIQVWRRIPHARSAGT